MVRLVNWKVKDQFYTKYHRSSIISTVWVYRLNDPPQMNVPNAETINPPVTMYLNPNLDDKGSPISEKIKIVMEAGKRAIFLNIYS